MKPPLTLTNESKITIGRDKSGVPRIAAKTESDLYFGQGYAQVMDRGLQLMLSRVVGQGRAGEILESSDELLKADIFFRRMNWNSDNAEQVTKLPTQPRIRLQAFADGINAALEDHAPREFKRLGYRPEPWKAEHVLLLLRMIGYLNLAQSQEEIERFLIEMLQGGIEPEQIEELFPGKLTGLDQDVLSRVKLGERVVPPEVVWNKLVPRLTGSNAWVVAGKKTAGGHAILAADPHLEINRLPNVWQEVILQVDDRYMMGASIPGLPGVMLGRTNQIAWGGSYAYSDCVDSWVEQCRGGKFMRKSLLRTEWVRFRERREVIKRKKKTAYNAVFYENEHGVLDGDPNREGYYLATSWTGARNTGAKTVESLFGLLNAPDVKTGMALLGKVELAMSWVLADREGNIGFQMSGLVPKRRSGRSGLVALPGWDSRNNWSGLISSSQLPRRYNPSDGYFVAANHDLNDFGRASPINVCVGPYRADRIAEMLQERTTRDVAHMNLIQSDLYSRQAERFMEILRPLLPDTDPARTLADWDLNYTADSRGASLFERFYRELFLSVFGDRNAGREVMEQIMASSAVFFDFYHNFDRILLSEESAWFGGKHRDELFKAAAETTLRAPGRAWGTERRVVFRNIFWGGRLPKFFGFDRGPYVLPGGRATVNQFQIQRSGDRRLAFGPSYRMIADMGEDKLHGNLAGGPGERRFSRMYISELTSWLANRNKVLEPEVYRPAAPPLADTPPPEDTTVPQNPPNADDAPPQD